MVRVCRAGHLVIEDGAAHGGMRANRSRVTIRAARMVALKLLGRWLRRSYFKVRVIQCRGRGLVLYLIR